MSGRCFLFVGPSGFGALPALLPPEVVTRPPVRRGDIDAVRSELQPDDVIALADGIFGDVTAVGHREILRALDDGVPVFGLCSMGALRAVELAPYGMRGFGRVFATFAADPDLPDDEVALLHWPEPPWRPLTEPLVHLRAWLTHAAAQGELSAAAAVGTIARLAGRWFGERTLSLAYDWAVAAGGDAGALDRSRREFAPYRHKQLDLQHFLQARPWSLI